MFIETIERRVFAIPAGYICGGLAIGSLIAMILDAPVFPVVVASVVVAALTGTAHAMRMLRRELECAYVELVRTTMMVTGARPDSMSLERFQSEMYRCMSQRLQRFTFSLIALREGSRSDAKAR